MRNLTKTLSTLKTFVQSELLSIVSISILKLGWYPRIFDRFLSVNDFDVPASGYSNVSDVELRVNYYLDCLSKVSDSDNINLIREVNADLSWGDPSNLPRIAFLTSGPSTTLTNTVMNNILESYDSSLTITINQGDLDVSNSKLSSIDQCEKLIVDFKPNVIFFELHTPLNSVAENTIFSREFVEEIKERTGAKVFILCFDIWREFDVKYIEYWQGISDQYLHFDEISARSLVDRFPMQSWLYPALNHTTFVPAALKTGIFFQGSIREFDRRRWLVYAANLSRKYEIKTNFRTFPHHNSRNVPPEKNYVESMNQAKYCLGLGQKAKSFWLVTFRSIEAISAGTILFQQTGPSEDPLSFFYKPFHHYLPFSSKLDLEAILFISRFHSFEIEKIRSRSLQYHEAVYGDAILWRRLIDLTVKEENE